LLNEAHFKEGYVCLAHYEAQTHTHMRAYAHACMVARMHARTHTHPPTQLCSLLDLNFILAVYSYQEHLLPR